MKQGILFLILGFVSISQTGAHAAVASGPGQCEIRLVNASKFYQSSDPAQCRLEACPLIGINELKYENIIHADGSSPYSVASMDFGGGNFRIIFSSDQIHFAGARPLRSASDYLGMAEEGTWLNKLQSIFRSKTDTRKVVPGKPIAAGSGDGSIVVYRKLTPPGAIQEQYVPVLFSGDYSVKRIVRMSGTELDRLISATKDLTGFGITIDGVTDRYDFIPFEKSDVVHNPLETLRGEYVNLNKYYPESEATADATH